MYTYDFKIENSDKNVGSVYLPDKNITDLPVIIYCHGWKSRRQLWAPTEMLCQMAIDNNMALVTFDFFGCGETGGDYGQMTYRRWKENLSDILDFVENQSFTNKDKIGCYAFSSGSTAALRFAAEDQRIAFVVSVGTCISTHIFMNSGGPAKWLSDNVEALVNGDLINGFGIDFCCDTVSNSPIHTMKNIKCPVLFLQGTADNPYRIADARMGYQIMSQNGLNASHIEFDIGTHELDNVIDEAMKYMFDWLIPILEN